MELVWKLANPTVTVREVFDARKGQHRRYRLHNRNDHNGAVVRKRSAKNRRQIWLYRYMPEYEREEFLTTAVKLVLDIFTSQFPRESSEFMEQYQAKLAKKAQRKK